jgi:enoyl-CoA hydratase/carnithine racemase
MQNRNTLAHFLHDAGLAAWFGGSLMGAIGVNGAAADVDDPRQRARVANAGWGRWTPFNLVAIGAHLVGGAQLLRANKGRVATQKGVLANTNVKLALTAGALGATAYSRLLGQKVMNAGDVPVAGGTESLPSTPPEVAKAQKQLKALQWAIPGLTGAVLASSSLHEEQQRPAEVLKGTLKAVPGRAAALGATAATAAAGAATGAFDKVSDKVREAV